MPLHDGREQKPKLKFLIAFLYVLILLLVVLLLTYKKSALVSLL